MKDLECPYCEQELDINHDDGFGYGEGELHQYECVYCGKSFVFTTSILFYYEPSKADCLNDGKHDWEITSTYPKAFSKMECSMCGDTRELTDKERTDYKVGSKDDCFKL